MRSHNAQKKLYRPFTKHHSTINYYTNPSEDEEFTPLVRSRPPRRRKGTSSHGSNAGKRYIFFSYVILSHSIHLFLISVEENPIVPSVSSSLASFVRFVCYGY